MDRYYRLLGRKIALAIVTVAFIPYALTFVIFYTSYSATIRAQVIATLANVVESHQRNIEEFLAERLANLQSAANLFGVEQLAQPRHLEQVLGSLRQVYGAFVDLGLLDQTGRHLAYAGPYSPGQADYSEAPWFRQVLADGGHVSDVFKGQREVPHFIVAVKLMHQERAYVLRATIDSARFSTLVEGVRLGSTGQAFIVNRQGLYQTRSRSHGQLLSAWDLPMPSHFPGVRVLEDVSRHGHAVVLAKAWLKKGDWLLVCQQDTSDAFQPLYQARRLGLAIGALGGVVVIAITWFFTRRLVGRISDTNREKELLGEQIIQSGKLASLGELAAGVAHEINNPVAIMVEEAGWMQDLMEEDRGIFEQTENRKEYERALRQIQTQGRRCKDITHKLLGFARRTDAPSQPIQVNDLVVEVLALLERPASYANVTLSQQLEPGLPLLAASPAELQQVLINLVNNAIDAMEKSGGEITVSTRGEPGGGIVLAVADNGLGIPPAVLPRIFDPFFTTKPVGKGTGLGLSICYGIVDKLSGRIEVQSTPGQGTTFWVHLPASPEAPPTAPAAQA
ncbi:MAG: two-component sensor histidine kinase [Desulfarculus sp.]|nr:two-component sensor histidine kinase [Desulfarculus sp.]